MTVEQLKGKHIAIPGKLTTAFLTLQLCIGQGAEKSGTNPKSEIQNPKFTYEVVEFDQIPKFVQQGKADAGLIIHEGQLTYQTLGLHLIVDLGQWWHTQTQLPLPLGGNCIRKDLGEKACQEITDILKQSIQYSLDHRHEAVEYALQFGRDLDRNLADKFVGMYVNDWTLDYGPIGRQAIDRLLAEGAKKGLVPAIGKIDYVTAK
jgi:1,4-dihydroxy-6-naphthoate synthase